MKKHILTAFLLLTTLLGCSQINLLKNEEATQALSKEVAHLFKEGHVSKGFNEMKKYWRLPAEEISRLEKQTHHRLDSIRKRLGQPVRYLKTKDQLIVDVAARETYLIQYEYTAIRLVFTYYHHPEGWLLHTFEWSDSFEEIFD